MTGNHLTHGELVNAVIGMAAALELQVWHWPDSRRVSRKGWPDLAIARPGAVGTRFMFREVKTGSARLTAEQRQVGYLMTAAGFNWAVWRTADWESGRIHTELRALARYAGVS